MADGSAKAIASVKPGDWVKSRNEATGQDEARQVTASVKRLSPAVVTVALADSKTGKIETLSCTPEHPLFVQGQGWVEAGSVGIGSSIVSRAGPALQVTGLTWQKNKAQELAAGTGSSFGGYTVYNLTVDGDHTFFVGTTGGGTWVHNICSGVVRRQAMRAAGIGRNGSSAGPGRKVPFRDNNGRSASSQGDPGQRTEWVNPDNGAIVHHDPYGTYYGPGSPDNIGPHYGVNYPGGSTEHFPYESTHDPSLNR